MEGIPDDVGAGERYNMMLLLLFTVEEHAVVVIVVIVVVGSDGGGGVSYHPGPSRACSCHSSSC